MGACCSGPSATPVSSADDSATGGLENAKSVLMLGTGGSGKTTIIKSLRRAHGLEETERELLETRYTIRVCMVRLMRKLQLASEELFEDRPSKFADCKLELKDDDDVAQVFDRLKLLPSETDTTTESLLPWAKALTDAWKLPPIRAVFRHRQREYAFPDNMQGFYDRIDDIFSGEFIPSNMDWLSCSVPSCGFVDKPFSKDGLACKLWDMGGRRNERKNWAKKFNQVFGVIYVVALTDYRSVLLEDDNRNAMHEALEVFASVASFDALEHSPFFLILNKADLFKEALMEVSMEECFSSDVGWTQEHEQWTGPDFDAALDNGERVYTAAIEFIQKAFERRKGNRSTLNIHVLSALDSTAVSSLFDDVAKATASVKLPTAAAVQ